MPDFEKNDTPHYESVGETGGYEFDAMDLEDDLKVPMSVAGTLDRDNFAEQQQAKRKKKKVSAIAMQRMELARSAIAYAKSKLPYAGNQVDDVYASHGNSSFRTLATRDAGSGYWNTTAKAKVLMDQNNDAARAAKALRAGGGNCGEYARVVYFWLLANSTGHNVYLMSSSKVDHMFVVIGNLMTESIHDAVAVDAWATSADPCLFEDHFCYENPKTSNIIERLEKATGSNRAVENILAGLSLNEAGKRLVKRTLPDDAIDSMRKREPDWLWDREEASKVDYDYVQ